MNPHTEPASDSSTSPAFSESELRRFSLEISGIGTWQLHPQTQTVTWDARCKELYGFAPDDEVSYDQVLRYMHPDDQIAVDDAVRAAMAGENDGHYQIQFRTIGATDGQVRWLLCKGQAFFDQKDQPVLFAGTAQDISELVLVQQQAARIERLAQEAIANAQAGTYNYDLTTDEFFYSPQTKRIFTGTPGGQFTRQEFIERVHPDDQSIRDAAHAEARRTGFLKYECRVIWDDGSVHWVRVNGAYEKNATGKNVLYNGIVEDITAYKTTQLALQKSERFARNVVQDSPVAKFITVGENQTLELVNNEMQALLGTEASLIGKPLPEAIPAFKHTSIPEILQQVRQTGNRIEVNEESFTGLNIADPGTRHYYHKHSPLRDEQGAVYGVISSWIDVTAEVDLRNEAATAQALLEAAIEAAQLGTFEINPATSVLKVSRRIREWMGFAPHETITPADTLEAVVNPEALVAAIEGALAPESSGPVDIEYQMVNRRTGEVRFVRSRGQRFADTTRGLVVVGTTQDITPQRSYALELERQVQLRTEELAAAIEELQATNEELATSNTRLAHSNEELAQYAYVASHDLQEPLRKIQVFSGMLEGKSELAGNSRELVGKIRQSASRMAQLIRDLLEFSRLLHSENRYQPTDLNAIVTAVRNDFELVSHEKNAVFTVSPLPQIEAVSLQMNQLFYNLIGNALKFTRPGVAPQITIAAVAIGVEEAAEFIAQPIASAQYYRIAILDNGIGFETQYSEHIFEVFKRLHGRDAYPGAGIGLALCRRIMANHNGALYTKSVPGQGAAFYLIVPDRQEG